MSERKQILCAKCKVPLEGPAEAKGEDVFSCPSCGEGDTLDNIMREISDQVVEQASKKFDSVMDKIGTNKFVTVTKTVRPKRIYRFIMNSDLHP